MKTKLRLPYNKFKTIKQGDNNHKTRNILEKRRPSYRF